MKDRNPKIISRNKDFLICHKPAGWLVYADSQKDSHLDCKSFLQKTVGKKIYPIHRLDKDTCGLVIFGLTPAASARLGEMFINRRIQKEYLALAHGNVPKKGEINTPLQENKGKRMLSAATSYKTLEQFEDETIPFSLVLLRPKTGRYHQIRRHLKSIGHPIIGDEKYGIKSVNEFFAKHYGITRTLLCASKLSLPQFGPNRPTTYETKPDSDFLNVLNSCSG